MNANIPVPAGLSESYRDSYRSLISRYIRDSHAIPRTPTEWEEMALWMVENIRPTVSNSTWGVYRGAIRACCGSVEARKILSIKGAAGERNSPSRPGKRKKNVSGAELAKLCRHLRSGPFVWGPLAANWLEASAFTGLRPSEWIGAKLEAIDGVLYLRIKTLKGNAGNVQLKRGQQKVRKYRHIPLSHLCSEDIELVTDQIVISRVMAERGFWDNFYEGCRHRIKLSNKKLFPKATKAINLYSGRHMYAAALKRAGVDKGLAGRLLGQVSGNAYQRCYGGRIPSNERQEANIEAQQRLTKRLDAIDAQEDAAE